MRATPTLEHLKRLEGEVLNQLQANGGGDYPEALDEALADSLAKPAWRPAGSAAQMIFLVADAPGHADREVPRPYTESMREAAERGIKIFPIASSESDDAAEVTFRQLPAPASQVPMVMVWPERFIT